ncbi:MAG: LCP family protein, partial [Clostridia bacterium]|nr:LCP family protein [Clostridia bacterium]
MNDEIFNENTAENNAVEEKNSAADSTKEELIEKTSKKDKKPKEKKKKKKWLIVLLCILLPILIIFGSVAGVYFSLMASYNKLSYVDVPVVERSNPYVEPPTDPQAPEWEGVEPEADDIGRDFIAPGQPIPNNEGGGGGSDYQGDPYDRNASFGRSPNAKSVYGKTPIYKVEKKDPNVENILIIGTDSRDVTRERGRSDALIVLSYNKKTKEIKMISILRDSLVPIEGHGWSRINHAYSWDGVGLCVNTVNELFDLDIQRFVVVDFNGVTDFVDEIGGVDMNLTQAEADYITEYSGGKLKTQAGMNHLNGDRALVYMRIRKIDSDFKRTERQRKVIEAVAKKIIAEKNLSEIYDLTEFAFGLIKTNITFNELTGTVADIATAALARR